MHDINNIKLTDIFFALCNTRFNSQSFYVLYVSQNNPHSPHQRQPIGVNNRDNSSW